MGAASVGIAAGMGAFDGIGAVQHSQSAGDVLDPATAAYVQLHIHGELDTARHVGQLPDGQNVYVITSSQNDLCAVVEPPNPSAWCGTPLSKAHPATLYAYPMGSDSPPTAWVDFGVALDGVTSVTFQPSEADRATPGGPAVTVPVNGNLWLYQGQRMTDILQPLTAHFADGTTVVEPATGNNCAAC